MGSIATNALLSANAFALNINTYVYKYVAIISIPYINIIILNL